VIPTFAQRRKAWSSPPVDDIGYLPATDLLAMDDDDFVQLIDQAAHNRYFGWRNHQGNWTRLTHVTHGKRVLDYGCGVGLEGLILAKRNTVFLADISEGNLAVAERAFVLNGCDAPALLPIQSRPPFIENPPGELDIILCLGVLHHIPDPVPVVKQMARWLTTGGELRLMVYSDKAWEIATGTRAPRGPVDEHPDFARYWQHWDAVGGYADWYDQARLQERFGEWFLVERVHPLTQHGEYLGAVLTKKEE
jgi:SAM-dependent methyltransferase